MANNSKQYTKSGFSVVKTLPNGKKNFLAFRQFIICQNEDMSLSLLPIYDHTSKCTVQRHPYPNKLCLLFKINYQQIEGKKLFRYEHILKWNNNKKEYEKINPKMINTKPLWEEMFKSFPWAKEWFNEIEGFIIKPHYLPEHLIKYGKAFFMQMQENKLKEFLKVYKLPYKLEHFINSKHYDLNFLANKDLPIKLSIHDNEDCFLVSEYENTVTKFNNTPGELLKKYMPYGTKIVIVVGVRVKKDNNGELVNYLTIDTYRVTKPEL